MPNDAVEEFEAEVEQDLNNIATQAADEVVAMINVVGQTISQLGHNSSLVSAAMQILGHNGDAVSKVQSDSVRIMSHLMFVEGVLVSLLDSINYPKQIEILAMWSFDREATEKIVKETYGISPVHLSLFGAIGDLIASNNIVGQVLHATAHIIEGKCPDENN